MTTRIPQEILVSVERHGSTVPVGHLYPHVSGRSESATFVYGNAWLDDPDAFAIDPGLPLVPGAQQTMGGTPLFGAMRDSAPDRWGRVLMRRALAREARGRSEVTRTLFEIDYLLRVNDEARQGALRYSVPTAPGRFLAPSDVTTIPPLVDLPGLLSAADHVAGGVYRDEDLRTLLAPGSSLGGARPKASVRDENGRLMMAKFPDRKDEFNRVLWEAVALALAERAGIGVPEWGVRDVDGQSVLLLSRFDRKDGRRIHYMSAMTLLGAGDMEEHSYVEIAEAMGVHSASPEMDKSELWRRVVFNILISNVDDHLRNHGFLLTTEGWRLSPAFDMNPTPTTLKPRVLATAIGIDEFDADLDTALAYAPFFGLSVESAGGIAAQVANSVRSWRNQAGRLGIPQVEIIEMESAFEHEDLEKGIRLCDGGQSPSR